MRKLVLVAALAVGVAGCSTLQNTWDVITQSKVSPTVVIVAANAFDALEATATNYLRLKKCTSTTMPVCRSPAATAQIVPAIRSGRAARNTLIQFLKDHPGQLGPQGLFDSLKAANATLQAIFAQYGIGG